MTDVCMLFQGQDAHPAHRSFGDSVGADYRHFETREEPPVNIEPGTIGARIRAGLSLDRYDVVIAEGTAPVQTLLSYKIRHPSTTAIYLAADETFYTLSGRPTRHLWRVLGPFANELLDGVVAVGSDVYEWARSYIGDVPVRYVHPPISDDKYERLVGLEPTSPHEPFKVLSAGMSKPANGYEQLVPAVERLSDRVDSDVQITILGNGHSGRQYADSPIVDTPGFVDLERFGQYFADASVYVQSSRGDSFPVAALEGILSGTPTLVTEAVGVREILPKDQAVKPTIGGIYNGIDRLYRMGEQPRTDLGTKQRSLVIGMTEANQREKFKSAIEQLQ